MKNRCYDFAFKLQRSRPELTLVHGIPMGQGPIEGIRHGHAWCELGDVCIDEKGEYPKALYYSVGQITFTRRYTLEQARIKANETGWTGPWDKRITKAAHLEDMPKKKRGG